MAIIEDIAEIREGLEMLIDSSDGFRCIRTYADGEQAVTGLPEICPDVLLMDINLPGMNGFEVCKAIRNTNQHVPIIMLTAMNTTKDKIEGFDTGTDDYMIKPFEFKELLVRIRALLKRTMNQQLPTGNILKVADLEMNLDTKEVSRAGQSIILTAKEFQLLEYFMRNRNRVLSRADIAERVWDIDFDTQTNVIDVYVNYLRNKIDKKFDTRLIHTQVGMGYIMKEPS